jgi:hypothetical protein
VALAKIFADSFGAAPYGGGAAYAEDPVGVRANIMAKPEDVQTVAGNVASKERTHDEDAEKMETVRCRHR